MTTCRRCGQRYRIERDQWLQSCPRCGASPAPLRLKIRNNALAAVLSLVALVILVRGQTMPFIQSSKLGEVKTYSLISGIRELYKLNYYFIASILLIFSVIFPIVKLIFLLLATSALLPIDSVARRRMHQFAEITGKYSLLDVLVAAVTIVVVRFNSLAEVRAMPGTIVFCIAVLLSLLASAAVDLKKLDPEARQ